MFDNFGRFLDCLGYFLFVCVNSTFCGRSVQQKNEMEKKKKKNHCKIIITFKFNNEIKTLNFKKKLAIITPHKQIKNNKT